MKNITQSHLELYRRYSAMANVLGSLNNPTDEQKVARKSLDEQALEHLHQAIVLGKDRFLMVVAQ